MPLNLVLVTSRQSPNGLALTWTPMEDVSSYQVFVAHRRLSPDELEGVAALGGTEECLVAKLGGGAKSVVDDVTPAGEARHYAVAMVFKDGTVRAARFRAVPDGKTDESVPLSSLSGGGAAPKPAAQAARPAAAPALRPAPGAAAAPARPVTSSGYRVPAPAAAPAAAAPAAADEDPLEARKRAQREARERAAGGAQAAIPAAAPARPAPAPAAAAPTEEDAIEARKRAQREARERAAGVAPAPVAAPAARAEPPPERAAAPPPAAAAAAEEDPIEARKRAQREARERAGASGGAQPAAAAPSRAEPGASAEPPPQPNTVELDGSLELNMKGATQTWDGLRLSWERDPRAAAYEVVVSDHQIFDEEVRDALAGRADFTTAVAVAPSVTCVIDNVTAREARGWYSVLARARDGKRTAISFQVGDAATSGKAVAPFLNANRTGEVRAEAEDLVGQAREQWGRWKSEQDGGARREAKRLIGDALLIFPNYPAARSLQAEMEG